MKETIEFILDYFFLSYGIALFACYMSFIVLALLAIKSNNKKAVFLNISDIKAADDLPSISLIAPAYNEGKTIIINVKSLLSLQYSNYELIIVNDGSKDDSLEQLINTFNLEANKEPLIESTIAHAKIKTIYKSTKKKYQHLTVIDKENGGRSDALNAGIASARTKLILCTDADCIIEQDALLKMVRPYLEELGSEIIASGGAIGIANDSIIKNSTLHELRLPKSLIARVQVVEYIRAFLLGRMAWSQIDGLMLVSGAFGLYPRQRVLEVGGFDTNTVGEDLELCIRLRTHMENLGLDYDVVYIPETLCWTEAPSTAKVYITQRDRWARGLWETMVKHRKLLLNRKFNSMGLVFYPYWYVFEFGAPIVEFLGLIYLIYLFAFSLINWPIAMALMLCVYLIGCIYSTIAILIYCLHFDHYNKPKMIIRLLISAYMEPFTSHPIMLYAEIKGYFKKIFGIKSTWGTMTRKGFTTVK